MQEVGIESSSLDQIATLTKDDYTEFYNDEIIKKFLNNELTPIPMSYIDSQDNRRGEVADWLDRATK